MTARATTFMTMLVLALTACTSPHKDKDYAAMNKIPMHSVCVGRMLVDLPKGGKVDWQQQFDYARVSRLSASINDTQQFWAFVNNRKQALDRPTTEHPKSTSVVYNKYGDDAAILLIRDSDAEELGYSIDDTERYLWLGNWGYKFETGALSVNEATSLLPNAEKTFKQLVPINNFRPPQEPGFCIDSAMVTGKIGPIWSSPSATVKGWAGVSVDAGAREDDGSRPPPSWQKSNHPLELPSPFKALDMKHEAAEESMRSDDANRMVSFDVLRKRQTELAGLTGEETAFKIVLANGQQYYRFDWSSTGDDTRIDKAGFTFDLEAGNYQYVSDYAAPPPEDDLLALWDAMLDSLKPRPGAG